MLTEHPGVLFKMSKLSVHEILGIAAYGNTVVIPTGHNFETYGKLVANGTLVVPTWDETTKPVADLVNGQLGFNTELGVPEVYGGPDLGWITIGKVQSQDLSEVVGVAPILHYAPESLADYSNSQVLNTTNTWANLGSLGPDYSLCNDTSGHYSSNVVVATNNGFKSAQFSGFCSLAFAAAGYYVLEEANANHNHTVAYVYGGGTSPTSGSDSSPGFNGHGEGPNTNIPDRVGGGLFGWVGSTGSWEISSWYENDGWRPLGIPSGGNSSTPNQWIMTVSGSTQKAWQQYSSGPYKNGSYSGGSPSSNATYGYRMIVSGMGNVRRADSSGYTCTGYMHEAVLFNTSLTDSQVGLLRQYFKDKYDGVGNVGL